MQPEGHDDVRVRFRLRLGGGWGGGVERDGMRGGRCHGRKEGGWDPERDAWEVGVGGPILPRSESTALPHF